MGRGEGKKDKGKGKGKKDGHRKEKEFNALQYKTRLRKGKREKKEIIINRKRNEKVQEMSKKGSLMRKKEKRNPRNRPKEQK